MDKPIGSGEDGGNQRGGCCMEFEHSEKSQRIQAQLRNFVAEHVAPRNAEHYRLVEEEHVFPPPFMEDLKAKARKEGLWNLFLPGLKPEEPGTQMSNLDYAPCAEIMGRIYWSSEVFNCSAPDTGNMELLHLAANPAQKAQWLTPLLDGKIRSSFAMTEPEVASSDATNIRTSIRRDGGDWVINGRKWFITNAADPRTKLFIVMGLTSPDRPEAHRRQSMVLVPRDAKGLTIVRNPPVMHHRSAQGHCEITFENVRVPAENLLREEGSGFALAQERLGPGRIHHCMRLIGCAQRALELMCQRAASRTAFGKPLAEQGSVREDIAHSFCEIAQARLLTLQAADRMDREGNKAARDLIAAAKIVVPSMAARVIDRAIQIHGAAGVSQDTFLARAYVYARFIRIGDGPDQVHLAAVGKELIKRGGVMAG
jgi:acyl-CoA dehydrogenase